MKSDPFEQHLSRQPWRPIPLEWREEILARATANPQPTRADRPLAKSMRRCLLEWLWPHPLAWAGLAACWLAILALRQLAAPSAAELAQARAGAQIAQVGWAALRNPEVTGWPQVPDPPPAAGQPPRRRGEQGRLVTAHPSLMS